MPFKTATPERATKPTAAEMEKGIPRIHTEVKPPVNAKGMPLNTRSASRAYPKGANSICRSEPKTQKQHPKAVDEPQSNGF